MTNLIPTFIAEKIQLKQTSGTFFAQSIFLDISGFTAMTEAFLKQGKFGAERLSQVINSLFDPLVKTVMMGGGFVSTFAGDAFTAIFPAEMQDQQERLVLVAHNLMDIFLKNPLKRTSWGDFILEAKIGLGNGTVEWGILGQGTRLGYYFRGEAITAATEAEKMAKPGTIVRNFNQQFETVSLTFESPTVESDFIPPPNLTLSACSPFLPIERLPSTNVGEFRHVVSLFVTFPETLAHLDEHFSVWSEAIDENGGYFNLLDFGDKGGVALVLFGAPIALEDGLEHALACALRWVKQTPEVRIGVSAGSCFVGYVGSSLRSTYTALGQVVNLSSRLASHAEEGQILLSQNILLNKPEIETQLIGNQNFKGLSETISVVRLLSLRAKVATKNATNGVGREAQKRQLGLWITSALDAQIPTQIGIWGELGTGKTQLANDLIREFTGDYQVLVLSSDPLFQKTFHPFRNYLEDRLSNFILPQEREQHFREFLSELAPDSDHQELSSKWKQVWAPLASLAGLNSAIDWNNLDVQARRERTLEALALLFELLAKRKPLILILENSQTLDEASLELLTRMKAFSGPMPFATLFLVRGQIMSSLDNGLDHRLELGSFNDDEMTQVVVSFDLAPPSSSFLEFLKKRTDSIPIYTFELLKFLKTHGLVTQKNNESTVENISEVDLPKTLADLLLRQIDQLPARLKAWLPAVSILGNRFPRAVFQEMLAEEAPTVLVELLDQGILRESPPDQIAFQKDVIREAIYSLQLDGNLRRLHAQAAAVWQKIFEEPSNHSEEKAFHWDRSGDASQAAFYYRLAAQRAQESAANDESITLWDRFLDLSDDGRQNALARYSKAHILETRGRWPEAVKEIERGIGAAVLSGSEDLFPQFFAFHGQVMLKQNKLRMAQDSLEKAIRDPRSLKISAELVQARLDLGRLSVLEAHYGEALGRFYEARDLAEENGFRKEEGLAKYALGNLFFIRNRRGEARLLLEESLKIFRELLDARLIANPLYDLSRMNQDQGRLDVARQQMQEVFDLYTSIDYKSGLGAALLNLGMIAEQAGDFSTARSLILRSRALTTELNEGLGIAYAEYCLGANAFKSGDLVLAQDYLQEADRRVQELKVDSYRGYALSYLVATLVRMKQPDEALDRAMEFGELLAKSGVDVEHGRVFLALAELLESKPLLSERALGKLQDFARILKITKVTATEFYRQALSSSRNSRYINTLIPTLHHFGEYLLNRQITQVGQNYIRACYQISRKVGFQLMVQRLEKTHPFVTVSSTSSHQTNKSSALS